MLTLYRLIHQDHAEDAWTGKTAMRVQVGRWHLPGTPMVYLASTLSQVLLLHQMHLQNNQALSEMQVFSLQVPEDIVIGNLDMEMFSTRRAEPVILQITRQLGTDWLRSKKQLLLRVPLTRIYGEYFYLLNTKHPDFKKCIISTINCLP